MQFREEEIIQAFGKAELQKKHRMVKYIREIMESKNERIYKNFRREHEARLLELDKEKAKILRRKKHKKEKARMIKMICIEKVKIYSYCVK